LNAPARVQAWNNGKFYVDFIYDEEFGWKIWHLHRFLTFKSEMERGPIHSQYTEKIERSAKVYADCFKAKPTKPTTYFSLFNPKARNYLLPEPPSAYESWDGMTDLERTRPYHNPDRPETMEGEVQTIVRLGRSEEGIGKAW